MKSHRIISLGMKGDKNIGVCMKENGERLKSPENLQTFWNESLKNNKLVRNLYFLTYFGKEKVLFLKEKCIMWENFLK